MSYSFRFYKLQGSCIRRKFDLILLTSFFFFFFFSAQGHLSSASHVPGILARREEENCTAQLILCACGRVRAICVLAVPVADGGPELVLPGQLALGLVAFTIEMSKSESPSSRGLDLALPELYPMGLCLFLANFIPPPPKIPEAALCGCAAGRTAGLELGGDQDHSLDTLQPF